MDCQAKFLHIQMVVLIVILKLISILKIKIKDVCTVEMELYFVLNPILTLGHFKRMVHFYYT